MGLQLLFADSFAHYDTAAIGLKWDTAGGSIDTSPAHVRTGPQSLKIQAGNSPGLSNRLQNAGFAYCTLGWAWQTQSLAGETIVKLIDSGSADLQIFLVQNADGSLSLWSGTPNTLLATSAAGTITIGPFWYIEMAVILRALYQTPQVIVTVTSSPGGVANQVINFTGVPTSQGHWDTLEWVGPSGANFAWIADFYALGRWDGSGDPLSVLGAPKIYGLNVPSGDGLDYVTFNTVGKTACFNASSPPFYPQCNSIPEDESVFLVQTDNNPLAPGWIAAGQAFNVPSVGVPSGSVIAAVQEVILLEAGAGTEPNNGSVGAFVGYDGDPGSDYFQGGTGTLSLDPNTTTPWLFYLESFTENPVKNLPWDLTEFGAGLQFGVWLGQPS